MIEKKSNKTNHLFTNISNEKFHFIFSRLGFTILKYVVITFICALFSTILVGGIITRIFTVSPFWSDTIHNILLCIFMLIYFMALLGRKIRYINEIQKGIQIIEGGSMDYTIPIRGKDELASLAKSINEMRQALDSEIKSKEKTKRENQQLITAVSHDIRTPLTSIICYLELIQDDRVRDPIKEKAYLGTALEKAHQIKGLVNSLFEHALSDNPEISFDFETINGNLLISQLIEEISFSLHDEGFQLILDNRVREDFSLIVDLKQIRRVFDNLVSNILKYADHEEPIEFELILNQNECCFIQRNKTKSHFKISGELPVDSNGIGIDTCRRIIQRHLGRLNCYQLNRLFKVELSLPIQK